MADSTLPLGDITIKIKSTTQSFDITVPQCAPIGEVKEVILTKIANVTRDKLCLIFSGKILKDHETLEGLRITNGMAVHLVVRQTGTRPNIAPPTSTPPAQAPTATSSTSVPTVQSTPQPNPEPSANSASPFGNLFGRMDGGNPANMAQQVMQNPEMMRQMMDSPIMQSLMSNPDVMRSMLASNPQIQNLIERNPEVGHILNDPDIMRQTMEMIRNPNMFNEMMRTHDLAIRNLQGIPGGEAALQRLYQDVQEPLLNSAVGSLGGNPYASNGNNEDNSSRSQRAGVENRDALPNPWAGGGNRPSAGTDPAPGGADPLSGMLGGGGMDSMMRQMMSDPTLMQSMMSPEIMNMVQQQVTQNPELLNQMLQSNPLVANNPQLAEQMRNQMPQLMSMIGRPEMMQAMTNPRVLEALRQIQAGTDTLRREAPELARMFGIVPIPSLGTPAASTPSGTPSAAPTAAPTGNSQEQMMRMMSNMFQNLNTNPTANPTAQNQNFEELYASQLEQLANMGFTNRAQNIAALRASFGDLNGAVERLLNSP